MGGTVAHIHHAFVSEGRDVYWGGNGRVAMDGVWGGSLGGGSLHVAVFMYLCA